MKIDIADYATMRKYVRNACISCSCYTCKAHKICRGMGHRLNTYAGIQAVYKALTGNYFPTPYIGEDADRSIKTIRRIRRKMQE